MLRDPKAAEIVQSIDYDFAEFDGGPSLWGSVVRTAVFDSWVGAFLAEHPTGTVVEIGTRLNTRFERLGNGRLHWVDLDLPDAMELRRRFFTEADSSTFDVLTDRIDHAAWLRLAAAHACWTVRISCSVG
ncbi:hypothetical protein ABZ746_30750 [Streptomyces sp. NPDC020096]